MWEFAVNSRDRIVRIFLTKVFRVDARVDKHLEEITDPRLNWGQYHDLGEIVFFTLTAAFVRDRLLG